MKRNSPHVFLGTTPMGEKCMSEKSCCANGPAIRPASTSFKIASSGCLYADVKFLTRELLISHWTGIWKPFRKTSQRYCLTFCHILQARNAVCQLEWGWPRHMVTFGVTLVAPIAFRVKGMVLSVAEEALKHVFYVHHCSWSRYACICKTFWCSFHRWRGSKAVMISHERTAVSPEVLKIAICNLSHHQGLCCTVPYVEHPMVPQ